MITCAEIASLESGLVHSMGLAMNRFEGRAIGTDRCSNPSFIYSPISRCMVWEKPRKTDIRLGGGAGFRTQYLPNAKWTRYALGHDAVIGNINNLSLDIREMCMCCINLLSYEQWIKGVSIEIVKRIYIFLCFDTICSTKDDYKQLDNWKIVL